jgi:hypothetical protein
LKENKDVLPSLPILSSPRAASYKPNLNIKTRRKNVSNESIIRMGTGKGMQQSEGVS